MDKPLCRHCGIRLATKPRGLCCLHYADIAVRDLYPAQSPCGGTMLVPDRCGEQPLPAPTGAHPGSPEKERILTDRALAGLALHHPGDERECASLAPDDALEDAIRQRLDDGQRPTDIARVLACPRARVYQATRGWARTGQSGIRLVRMRRLRKEVGCGY